MPQSILKGGKGRKRGKTGIKYPGSSVLQEAQNSERTVQIQQMLKEILINGETVN